MTVIRITSLMANWRVCFVVPKALLLLLLLLVLTCSYVQRWMTPSHTLVQVKVKLWKNEGPVELKNESWLLGILLS